MSSLQILLYKLKSKINWADREKELKDLILKNIEIKTKNMMF